MAAKSAYFCEKSGTGGLIGLLLCTVQIYMDTLVCRVSSNYVKIVTVFNLAALFRGDGTL